MTLDELKELVNEYGGVCQSYGRVQEGHHDKYHYWHDQYKRARRKLFKALEQYAQKD